MVAQPAHVGQQHSWCNYWSEAKNPALSKQTLLHAFDVALALVNFRLFGVRLHLLPTVLTLPGESFAVAGGSACGISALRLWYTAPPCCKNAVRFATALEMLKPGWT